MDITELIIEAGRTESQYWKDLWRYRELFYFLENLSKKYVIGYQNQENSTLWDANAKQVASLLEVGTGFHLEIKGDGDIYPSVAVLGISQKDKIS